MKTERRSRQLFIMHYSLFIFNSSFIPSEIFFRFCTFSFVQTKEKRTKKKGCRLPLRGGSIAAFAKEKELTSFKQLFLFYAKASIPLFRPSTKGREFWLLLSNISLKSEIFSSSWLLNSIYYLPTTDYYLPQTNLPRFFEIFYELPRKVLWTFAKTS